MPIEPLSILILVACALAWSSFDLVRKLLLDTVEPMPLVFLLAALQTPLFALWNQTSGGPWVPGDGYLLPALLSVALNIVSNVLFIFAIKVSPLSLTIPLLSFTPVFTTVLAIPMLGEIPGPLEVVGIVLVVIGAFALHVTPGEGPGAGPAPAELWRAFLRERGSVMMACVAFMWSITPPLDKMAVGASSSAFHGTVLSAGVAAGLGVVLAVQGRLGRVIEARRRPKLVAGALAASALALGLQLVAIKLVFVSLVETVKRGLGNGAAVALGAWMFHESVGRWQWLAVVLMGVGVAMILL
jgi:drug/metabolite transporter (DMT)-like permease